MICCVDTSNIFFITWSMFKKDCLQKNGNDYVIKEEDLTGTVLENAVEEVYHKRDDYINAMTKSKLNNSIETIVNLIESVSK